MNNKIVNHHSRGYNSKLDSVLMKKIKLEKLFFNFNYHDWQESIPLIKPFYERFFGEELPEDLEDIIVTSNSETYCGKAVLGRYTADDDMIYLKQDHINFSELEIASVLIHELAHRMFERESGLINSCARWKKSYFLNLILHECVAHTVSTCFDLELLLPDIQLDQQSTPEVEELTFCESDNYLDNYNKARFIGGYLATKYQNDPQLWDKLKQLRTLDDLKRLI